MELRQVEQYWETRVELVSSLKKSAASNLMAQLSIWTEVPEGVYVVDMEGASPDEPMAKSYDPTAASTSSPSASSISLCPCYPCGFSLFRGSARF